MQDYSLLHGIIDTGYLKFKFTSVYLVNPLNFNFNRLIMQ